MAFNLTKKSVVGVSISLERGLEVAQVDFETKTLIKYGSRHLVYDYFRGEVADRDKFKEDLQELFVELQIPKGTEVVLNFPTVSFMVLDYSAAYNEQQITAAVEEEMGKNPPFENQNMEPVTSSIKLPVSTIQFSKIASVALSKEMAIEIAIQIKELGYKLIAIDTSVGSTLNALMYNDRVNIAPDASWVLLFVENNCCRILSMQGASYVDCFEEKISIGEVLGDEENYSIVTGVIAPILKNLPSQCLYIVSKTSVISAEKLANSLTYNAPIIHQEDNQFSTEMFLACGAEVDSEQGKAATLDVIGAAIYREFSDIYSLQFNLYNAALGDVYLLEQPPVFQLGERLLVFSMQNMVVATIVTLLILAIIGISIFIPLSTKIANYDKQIKKIEKEISIIQLFLDKYDHISSNAFDEGDEVRIGLAYNKNIYSYYTIVGTEIPQKLWLTALTINNKITIEGQADNLESIYTFFRNIRDYNPKANIKLQRLVLSNNSKTTPLDDEATVDMDSLITSASADFYEFKISNDTEVKSKTKASKKTKSKKTGVKDLEPIKEL